MMERRLARWGTPLLALLLVITGIWGYQEHRDRVALEVKTENHYQQSFHDLSYQMDQLQDNLGRALASSSRPQVSRFLHDANRQAYVATTDISHLPLGMMSFNQTQEFVNRVGDYSKTMALNVNTQTPLSQSERQSLRQLYHAASRLEDSLKGVQTHSLTAQATWLQAEAAMRAQSNASTSGNHDNVIVDGFRAAEKQVKHYNEINFSPLQNGLTSRNEGSLVSIGGPIVGKQDVAHRAARFLGLPTTTPMRIVTAGKGARYPAYFVTLDAGGQGTYHLDVTQHGGHIVQMLNDRTVSSDHLDLTQAESRARQFLSNNGIAPVATVLREQYNNVATIQFVPEVNGVVYYPRKVVVYVALDNGQIVGYGGQDYLAHRNFQSTTKPKLTAQSARKLVSPDLTVEEENLGFIEDQNGRQRLVYAFLGTMDSNTYHVYVDANTGQEVNVEKLTDALPSR